MTPRNRWFPLVLAALVLVSGELSAQTAKRKPKFDPVKWDSCPSSPPRPPQAGRALGRLTATIEKGWRLYAPTTAKGGPIPTELKITDHAAIAAWTPYQPEPQNEVRPQFSV